MKLAIFNLHMLYFQCVKGRKTMASINAINSQVSFGHRIKKADGNAETKRRPMFTWNGLGGKKDVKEKYKDVEITEASAPIIYKDKYLDKAIEYAVAGIVFVAAFLGGKKAMRGVTGGFVDTTKQMAKNQDGVGIMQNAKKYYQTLKDNIKTTKNTDIKKVKGVLNELESEKALNAGKKVVKGSVIDKIAARVDDEQSIASKIANTKLAKQVIAGSKENAEKITKVTSDDVRNMFAKNGITRGADGVDTLGAGVGASIAATAGRDSADVLTDLNDGDVAEEAHKANKHYMQKLGRAASAMMELL